MHSETLSLNIQRLLTFVLTAVITAAVVMVLQPLEIAVLTRIVTGLKLNTAEGVWYLLRSAGLVAYFLLWLSTVWGLAVAGKMFDRVLPRAFTFDAHEWLSLLAIGFTALHVGALLFDTYLPFSIVQILIPFTSTFNPLWVGVGVIALYLTLLVTVTFYLRRRIGQKAFRSIHLLSFAAYAGVTLHSLFAGTDSALLSTKLIYASTALIVGVMTILWYRTMRLNQAARASKAAAISR